MSFDCRRREACKEAHNQAWKEAANKKTLFEFARVLLIEYRHLFQWSIGALLMEGREDSLMQYRAVCIEYRALLMDYRAVFIEGRHLLLEYWGSFDGTEGSIGLF